MSNRKKGAVIALVLVGAALGAGYWLVAPKYVTATSAEIRARIDPALLVPIPGTAETAKRSTELEDAISRIVRPILSSAPGMPPTVPAGSPGSKPTEPALDLKDPRVRKVIAILEEGPITESIDDNTPRTFPKFSDSKELAKRACVAAKVHAASGNWTLAQADLDFAYRLLGRLQERGYSVIEYLINVAIEQMLDKTTLDISNMPAMPSAFGRGVLKMMPKNSADDSLLARAIVGEFQGYVLDRLPDPREWMKANLEAGSSEHPLNLGNYDALKSADLEGSMYLEMLQNASRKKSEIKDDAMKRVESEIAKLPAEPAQKDDVQDQLQNKWFEFRMNLVPNSLGAYNITQFRSPDLMRTSYRARTTLAQVRSNLAVAVYRHEKHRNPTSYAELVAAGLLHEPPYDFLSDAPMPFGLSSLSTWPKYIP